MFSWFSWQRWAAVGTWRNWNSLSAMPSWPCEDEGGSHRRCQKEMDNKEENISYIMRQSEWFCDCSLVWFFPCCWYIRLPQLVSVFFLEFFSWWYYFLWFERGFQLTLTFYRILFYVDNIVEWASSKKMFFGQIKVWIYLLNFPSYVFYYYVILFVRLSYYLWVVFKMVMVRKNGVDRNME